jgi:dGTPase
MAMRMNWSTLLNATRTRTLIGGRMSKPTSPGEDRSEFEKDFDRAIYSSPVRRLQDKAQVWPLERNDFVRTRLTHSLEVSSVARGLGTKVARWVREVSGDRMEADDVHSVATIAATCGLLHDLGNPPFGHAGEGAMKAWFESTVVGSALETSLGGGKDQKTQDFVRFDGNPQTIRLVAHLQTLSDRYGLNLTAGTLSALLKYTARSHEVDKDRHEKSKPGFFWSEDELVTKVRAETGTGDSRNPIACLVEASDDIVYSIVDIEDGVRKGVLGWGELEDLLCAEADSYPVGELFRRAEKYIADGGLAHPGRSLDDAHVQSLRTFVIGEHVAAVAKMFTEKYSAIMDGSYHGELVKDAETADFLSACKTVGQQYVYRADPIIAVEVMGHKVLSDLMDVFWEGAQGAPHDRENSIAAKKFSLMSDNYRTVFEMSCADLGNEDYCRLQLVADYVSGMTDSFAATLHQKLRNG